MRSMSHWFSMLRQSSWLLLLQFYWPANVVESLLFSLLFKHWKSHCQRQCGQCLVVSQCLCNFNCSCINLRMVNYYLPSFSHCLRKILPANTMRSMCCWSSLLLRCQLLLHWQLDCSLNVSIKSPFFILFKKENLTCKYNVINVLLLFNASAIAIAPSSPIPLPYECSILRQTFLL